MINMLALDGHIVHAVGAGDRPLGDDLEGAGQAAEAFAGLEVLGGEPLVAGLAVELVEGGGADGLLGRLVRRDAPYVGEGQLDDAGVEVVDRGEAEADLLDGDGIEGPRRA